MNTEESRNGAVKKSVLAKQGVFCKGRFYPLRKIHMTAAHLWQSERRLWERSNHSVSNRN